MAKSYTLEKGFRVDRGWEALLRSMSPQEFYDAFWLLYNYQMSGGTTSREFKTDNVYLRAAIALILAEIDNRLAGASGRKPKEKKPAKKKSAEIEAEEDADDAEETDEMDETDEIGETEELEETDEAEENEGIPKEAEAGESQGSMVEGGSYPVSVGGSYPVSEIGSYPVSEIGSYPVSEMGTAPNTRQTKTEQNKTEQNSTDDDITNAAQSRSSSPQREQKIMPQTPEEILQLYGEMCPSLSPAVSLTGDLRQKIDEARKQYSPQQLRQIFAAAQNTPFLRGEGPKGWKASLGWLLKNGERVLGGEFSAFAPPSPRPSENASFDTDDFFEAALRRTYGERAVSLSACQNTPTTPGFRPHP